MRIVKYSFQKLGLGMIAGIAATVFGIAMLGADRGKVQFAGFILAAIGPFMTLATIKTLLGDLVALRISADSLEINTLWRRNLLRWNEIEDIEFRQVNTYAAYGLIKTGSSRTLQIRCKGGLFGKKLNLSRVFLDIDDEQYYALPAIMDEISQGRAAPVHASPSLGLGIPRMLKTADISPDPRGFGRSSAISQPAAPAELTPQRDEEFDPDAVLNRYLAKKAAAMGAEPMLNGQPLSAPGGSMAPQVRGFGRKGL